MSEKRYRVEYHVTGVLYLENGGELLGPEFAQLWAGTGLYGKQLVTGAFWREGAVTPERRIELGALEALRPFLEAGDAPLFGGGVSANSTRVARNVILDQDFNYAHQPSSRSFGYVTNPSLTYAVSGQWFERAGTERVLDHLKEHFAAADRRHLPYGLIDISSSEDSYGGRAFGSPWVGNIPLHRWVEQVKWLYTLANRRDQVRGIYWGNYFGSAILNRLGGRDHFLERFQRQARFPDGRPSARVWEFTNGVLVTLCGDPLSCKPGQPLDGWAGQNMHWLVLELGSHGVLDPWSGNERGTLAEKRTT